MKEKPKLQNTVFGPYILNLRSQAKKTLSQVMRDTGISTTYLSEMERKEKEPSDDMVVALAKYYEVDEDELFRLLERIPKSIRDELHEVENLQKLIDEVRKNSSLDHAKKEKLYKKLISLYRSVVMVE